MISAFCNFSNNEQVREALKPGSKSVFTGLSSDVQNELIEIIALKVLWEIKERMENAKYVSIMADETTDISNKSQMCVTVRFIHNGKICEHLVDLVDVSEDRRAEALADKMKESLKSTLGLDGGSEDKCFIVGQSYDGAANMAGCNNSVQTLLQEVWPHAHFVHCYAHKWALVVRKACTNIPDVELFFSDIQEICAFFRASPKRGNLLQGILATSCPTRWLSRGKSINSINKAFDEIAEILEQISLGRLGFASEHDVCEKAKGFKKKLTALKTVFLLKLFRVIFTYSDAMAKILQTVNLNPSVVASKVEDYKMNLLSLRSDNEFENIYELTNQSDHVHFPKKRKVVHSLIRSGDASVPCDEESMKKNLKGIMFEVIDVLCTELNSRFGNLKDYEWLSLLSPVNFKKENSRKDLLSGLQNKYPTEFTDTEQLWNELMVLYSDSQLKEALKDCQDPVGVFEELIKLNLHTALPTIFKALQVGLTVALTSVKCERTFSYLRRIKAYTRSTTGQDRLKWTMLTNVESTVMSEISAADDFCDAVIETFAKRKDRRLKLLYRH